MSDPTEDVLDKFFSELSELDGISDWMNEQVSEFEIEEIFDEVRDHVSDTITKSRETMTKFRKEVLKERNAWKAEALAARKLIAEIGSRLEGSVVGETVNSDAMLDYLIARGATPSPELDAEEEMRK